LEGRGGTGGVRDDESLEKMPLRSLCLPENTEGGGYEQVLIGKSGKVCGRGAENDGGMGVFWVSWRSSGVTSTIPWLLRRKSLRTLYYSV
jgi:hypothetical protein